ncbi:MAG TPA: L,D-transpeptidase [Anaerolineales bacterium]|nr:L,D-transpeptidase [Anaerolineales bacterium]
MTNQLNEAREFITQARESLRRGDKSSARQLGERAALLVPEMEDAWLVLAASDPDPQDALAYAHKALELNPQSQRAQKAVEWATGRLAQIEALKERAPVSPPVIHRQADELMSLPAKPAQQSAMAAPGVSSKKRNWLLPALLIGAVCMLLGLAALFLLMRPQVTSLVRNISAPDSTHENLWAPVEITKPEETAAADGAVAVQLDDTPTPPPTEPPTTVPTVPTDPPTSPTPNEAPTQAPTQEQPPAATETPGTFSMEIVEDTPTSQYVPPKPEVVVGNGGRWIDVDLTNQMVYAYEGDVVVNSFLVSTGTWGTPTVTGKYKIYVKVRMQDMSGPGYHLRDVPWVMFFYGDYGLHGTYWHNNFGTPMSRGCVNLTIDDAAWLFNWASVGTVVNVHY